MNFKKIIAMTGAIAVCAGLLTACGGDSGTAENTSATTTSEETVISEDGLATEDTVSEQEEEASADEITDSIGEETSAEEEANPLQPLADAAIMSGEWPTLWEVTDAQMLSDFFLLDAANENYRNILVLQCPMSANMTEIIIIEADDVSAAVADLEARQKKAREMDAFYPNDVEKAEASIVGSEGDYAYFILADGASDAETALVEAIGAL